jgi:hypothetical protein
VPHLASPSGFFCSGLLADAERGSQPGGNVPAEANVPEALTKIKTGPQFYRLQIYELYVSGARCRVELSDCQRYWLMTVIRADGRETYDVFSTRVEAFRAGLAWAQSFRRNHPSEDETDVSNAV